MNAYLKSGVLLVMALAHAPQVFAQTEGSTVALGDDDLPVTIQVLQDVQITAVYDNGVASDASQPASRYAMVILGLRKDQQFQMIDIYLEGTCQISFEDKPYDLASCPWLPGFRDHREDIFMVIEKLPIAD